MRARRQRCATAGEDEMRAFLLTILTLVLTASLTFARDPITLDVEGAVVTTALDVNDAGDVVGSYYTADGRVHGFLWSNGAFKTVDGPNSVRTELWGVNNRGDIVGEYFDGVRSHGFVLRNGVFTLLLDPDGEALHPRDINNRGDIVGYRSSGYPHGFLLDSRGAFTAIQPQLPGRTESFVWGVNDARTMVGIFYFITEYNAHGFLLDHKGDTSPFGAGFVTHPTGINNAGLIVGWFIPGPPQPFGNEQGFVVDHGAVSVITIPGASRVYPYGVNNRGDIVGSYYDGVQGHGFVLKN